MRGLEGSPGEIWAAAPHSALHLAVRAGPDFQQAQHHPDYSGLCQAAMRHLLLLVHFWKSALHWPAGGHSFHEEVPADENGSVSGLEAF